MERIDSSSGRAGSGRFTRRRLLQTAGAAAAVPAMHALGAGRSVAAGAARRFPAGGDPVTLSLAYLGDATQQEQFDALFGAFNEAHPDIKLEANGIPAGSWGNFVTTVATQLAGGQKYDIVQIATEGQRLFASKNLLLPLDDYIAADQEVIDDYFADVDPNLRDWTLKYGSPDGQTYYIPGGYNTVVMYCNTAVFEEAGVELPESDWTWDEFYEAGVAIKEATGAFLHPMGYEFPFVNIMPWLLTNGASTMDEEWETATYNTPEAVEAAEFVKRCIDEELSPVPGGEFDALAQLSDGRLASIGGGRWVTGDIRRLELVEQVRIVNWPTNAGNGSPVGWDGWPILKSSENPDAAWAFLRWMTSVEASEYYAEIGGTIVPARNSVATSDSFLTNAPAGSELLASAIGYATPIPSPDNLPEVETAVTEGWQSAITGDAIQEALDGANETIQSLL